MVPETVNFYRQVDRYGNVSFRTDVGYRVYKTTRGYQVEPDGGGWFVPVTGLKRAESIILRDLERKAAS